MYDDEEEIKKKRRKLIMAIVIVVVLIILLLIFIISRSGGKKTTAKELACELEVKSGTLGEDGIYSTAVEVGFKSITAVSPDIQITKNTVGTSDNARNKDIYTISKKGTVKVYGYVQDAAGNKGTCSLEVKVNPSKPTCELQITSGTLGENGWYKTNVGVAFKSKDSNSEDTTIKKYYIIRKTTELGSNESIKTEVPTENVAEYIVKHNAINEIEGHVIDSNGNEGVCSITVKIDAIPPTCSLKVVSGTANSSGIYTDTAVVGFAEVKDTISDIQAKGIGTSKNYTNETGAVTAYGNTTVYGYVKDKAGNEATCSILIKRPTDPNASTHKDSYPSCTLKIVSGTANSSGTYIGKTVVGFNTKSTTNNATIKGYGIGTSPTVNGAATYEITTSGNHTIIGMIKDSYGNTSTCTMTVPVSIEDNLLAKKVKVGDFVAYDAGTWNGDNKEIPDKHNTFGGYISGSSKNSSVTCRTGDSTSSNGWKVLAINGNQVSIVHAGIPECYFYSSYQSNSNIAATLNERASVYKNEFAASARMLNESDVANLAQDNGLRKINSYYYLATPSTESKGMKFITTSGRLTQGGENAQGVRPVITLRADVRTTGQSNGAWVLTFEATKNNSDMQLTTTGKIGDLFNFVKDVVDNS